MGSFFPGARERAESGVFGRFRAPADVGRGAGAAERYIGCDDRTEPPSAPPVDEGDDRESAEDVKENRAGSERTV